ncbi:MAG: undecaprenyl/decaprenyl-phosphate alpha-N-acetylglucosaminyl 1-phosphate transferase [Vicinamibacteria bacterium]|nr:undecaprenyl/decaprenyl-phosphate alpha-N-acetylglucosaminyl 1-phosphate transferase [Vicinamibacteria bacterium]
MTLLLHAAVSALLAFVLTPMVAKLSVRLGVMDLPGPRKAHREAVPRLGGLAVLLGASLGLAVVTPLAGPWTEMSSRPLVLLLLGGLAVFLIGLLDDVRGLSATGKLLAEAAVAILVVASGVRIERATLLGSVIELGVFAPALTVLWIVVLTNAFNLIDGLDGLATGVALISGSTCALILAVRGNQAEAVILAALVGAALGFLPHNFSPARIFLGDCGSLLFGYFLATTAITGFQKGATVLSVGAPMLLFALPLVETTASIVRRSLRGAKLSGFRGLLQILVADQEHIHHRLIDAGLSPKMVVLVLYTLTLGLCFLALFTVRNVP